MSLLHKTNSVLSILSAKGNNSLAFNYPDVHIYKTTLNDQNNNAISNQNSNINLTNYKNENDIIGNINNIYNENIQEIQEKNFYNNNIPKNLENNIYKNTYIQTNEDNNIYNNNNIIQTNSDNNYIYNTNIKNNPENNDVYSNIQTNSKNNIYNNNFQIKTENNKIIETNTEYNFYNNNTITSTENHNYTNNNFIPQDISFQNVNNKEFLKTGKLNSNINNNIKINSPQDIYFNNDNYSKIIIENNLLKEKLIQIESEKKTCKTETERQLLLIRDENSKLQLEIQRLISKEKASYNQYQGDIKEKNDIINNQKQEIKILKVKIKEISNENLSLLNNIQNQNNKIIGLTNDKQILIDEIAELNKSLNENIKPKLMKNEDYLISLEKQIVLLKKKNDALIQNDIQQKSKISIMEKENKLLKQTIDNYSSIPTIEDLTINNIYHRLHHKKNNKKYSSCKIFQKEENQKNMTTDEDKSVFPKNKMKHCISLKNLKLPIKSRNNNYNYNYKKINNEEKNIMKNKIIIKSLKNKRSKVKENENKLYYNTTIKKKNINKIHKNEFYKSKIENGKINNQLKNYDDIMNKKCNKIMSNINNLSESKSLLSSYTEEIIL